MADDKQHLYNIYSFRSSHLIGAGLAITQDAYLNENNRQFKILSITNSMRIWNNVTGQQIKFMNSDTLRYILQIGDPVLVRPITKTFYDFSLPAAVVERGNIVNIHEPGQYLFNSFYVWNTLLFRQVCSNQDALNGVTWEISLIVETLYID